MTLRRIWSRELRAFEADKPLKQWTYDREALNISRGELWEQRFESGLRDGHQTP